MKIGVNYYPEQWPEDLWESDADRMKEIGVDVVRLAEFAWGKLEPEEGIYHFAWLDQAIRLFQDREIEVILGTPTCTPPQWMFHRYPEIIQVDSTGHRVATGIRGHRCMNHPAFLEFSHKMITEMVSHYRSWEAVIGYQIDNELEANHCRCHVCQERFRNWVREKYGTVEAVNSAYGNTVWSGEYSSFEEIAAPMGEQLRWMNPSLHLDYQRYASDSTVWYARQQAAWIRENDPDAMITTNTWLCEHMPDWYDLFADLDFVSYDNYPATKLPEDGRELYSHAFHLDLMRGILGKPYWIMEQLSGAMGSWAPMSRTPKPGMIRGYALQAYAHGADAVLHFRWRTARSGAEMYWQGILDPGNVPGRRYQEFRELCQAVRRLPQMEGAMPYNKVAVLYSSVQEYAFQIQHQAEGRYYLEHLKSWHDAFSCLGMGVDIIAWDAPLDHYDIVVAPNLLVGEETVVRQLYDFTAQGGTLILTNRCGVKDEHNQCMAEPVPSVYRDLAGVIVTEYDPLGETRQLLEICDSVWDSSIRKWKTRITGSQEQQREYCTRWCDLLEVTQEEVDILAVYGEAFYQGMPAVTRHRYEDGSCYYQGAGLLREGYISLAETILQEEEIPYYPDLPLGVERTERTIGDVTWQFWFNNTENTQVVPLEEEIVLEPFEMKMMQVS
ncbi:MAG: beta-galactosidase [Lachnospiraceae bacterium]|nr:beta-galactosidase [Lachnospiraceae bacterium]